MDYRTSPNFRHNLDTLVYFPKNNESAIIKADSSGKLFSSEGGFYDRAVGYASGTVLKETASVIDITSREIIQEASQELLKAKKTNTLDDLTNARELFLKAHQALDSMKIIHRVYSNRYEGQESEGVKNLGETIKSFEMGLKRFAGEERDLGQRIVAATAVIFKQEEDDLDLGSFMHIPSDVEPNKAFAGVDDENVPKVSSWWGSYGEGPTMLGKLASGWNTATEITKGAFAAYSYTPSTDPVVLGAQKRVANGGRQLGGADVQSYIEGIRKDVPVNSIDNFYLMPGNAINTKTLEQVKSAILAQRDYFQNPDLPLVIPVTFSGEGVWERNHIAVILIKDNCVEYYDGKGIVSANKELAKGSGSLRDVLEFCKEHFTKEGHIKENPYPHQYDAHNCGVFVCRHLHDRLINKTMMGTMQPKVPTLSEVEDFRKEVIQRAYGPQEFKTI